MAGRLSSRRPHRQRAGATCRPCTHASRTDAPPHGEFRTTRRARHPAPGSSSSGRALVQCRLDGGGGSVQSDRAGAVLTAGLLVSEPLPFRGEDPRRHLRHSRRSQLFAAEEAGRRRIVEHRGHRRCRCQRQARCAARTRNAANSYTTGSETRGAGQSLNSSRSRTASVTSPDYADHMSSPPPMATPRVAAGVLSATRRAASCS